MTQNECSVVLASIDGIITQDVFVTDMCGSCAQYFCISRTARRICEYVASVDAENTLGTKAQRHS